jgi:Na+/H+ antiporter NhaA
MTPGMGAMEGMSGGQTMRSAGWSSPLRSFLTTEAGSAAVLVAAVALALAWANVAPGAYDSFWTMDFPVRIGPVAANLELRTWVNSGLMAFFFLVVGLEARREFDLGDLRDRSRLILPVAAGLVGMAVPVAIYLGLNGGGRGAHGWGVAMSSDTALALGAFALLGRGVPGRVRIFLLTVFVVDDVMALAVIAIAYSGRVNPLAIAVAVVAYAALLLSRRLPYPRRRIAYILLGVTIWSSLLVGGVDPVVAGLAIGLATLAYEPARGTLEHAIASVRLFRQQPSAELVQEATRSLIASLSPNERLQHSFHRSTSYLVVPLFALANAGIAVNANLVTRALVAPITLGVFAGYVLGKPLAVLGTSWVVTAASRGRVRPQVGWGAVLGSGTIAGIGFTVSLLIANLAFAGDELQEAKLGVLCAAVGAFVTSAVVYRVMAMLPEPRRTRLLLGDAPQLIDLEQPVDLTRDHVQGPEEAAVTVVEYGDYECPWTGLASPTTKELLAANPDVRYVWRHLPLSDIHAHAKLAAEAAEAAGAQGKFWAMHDLLLSNQTDLEPSDIVAYAEDLDLDLDRFRDDLAVHLYAARVDQDVESADISGVAGTPTFFINDQRHHGAQDLGSLTRAIAMSRASSSRPAVMSES